MSWRITLAAALAVILGLGAFATATRADIAPPPDRGQRVCPMIYQPVCGTDGRTYSNRCVAEGQGARTAYDGQCRSGPPRACPRIYRPVCGSDNRTYPNRCEAERAGVTARYDGQCYRRDPGRGDGLCGGRRGIRCNRGEVCDYSASPLGRSERTGVCRPDEPRGRVCGGIAGVQCPRGESCRIREVYPDAQGVCIPNR